MATSFTIWIPLLWMSGWSLAQQQYNEQDQLGYTCTPGSQPCQAYAAFRANDTYSRTTKEAALIFGESEEQVATVSALPIGVSNPPGKLLLIPLNCSCVSGRSQYNTSYVFQKGDTMFLVSTTVFQGLTTYQAVERTQPSVDPRKILPSDSLIFPIRCACPSKNQTGVRSLVTYPVVQGDNLTTIAEAWNVSQADVLSENVGLDPTKLQAVTTLLLPMTVDPPVLPQQALTPVTQPSPPTTPAASTPPSGGGGGGGGNDGLGTGAIVGISVGSAVAAAALIVLAGFCIFCLVKKNKDAELTKPKSYSQTDSAYNSTSFDTTTSSAREAVKKQNLELVAAMAGLGSDKPVVFSYAELEEATNHFSHSHLIQGSVYRGVLRDKLVAIKEMKGGTTSQELRILAKVHHSNLVSLVGVCSEDDHFFLVYEYAENGSLSSCLHDKLPVVTSSLSVDSGASTSVFLSWNARLQVALDVASGLEYIHDYTQPSFVHKDIKSSNILLDSNVRAKIANFGMARLTEGTDGSSLPPALTKHISGTQGYMAPEYLTHGFVTTKVDVYAFGVVMMELITGREAMLSENSKQQRFLSQVIADVLDHEDDREKRLKGLKPWLDPSLNNAVPWDVLYSFAVLARSCVDADPHARPGMKDVASALSKMFEDSLQWETEEVLEKRYNSAQLQGR